MQRFKDLHNERVASRYPQLVLVTDNTIPQGIML
jgi:hypothetical protein